MKISNFKFQISNKKHSFTLIEVLLAVSIFTILMTMGITSYGTIMNWKKRDISNNELQAAGRHAMEVMTHEIEKADLNTPVADGTINRFGFSFSAQELKIYPTPTTPITFKKDGTAIKRDTADLTPSTVNVTKLEFSGFAKDSTTYIGGSYQQPYVTISMTLQSTQLDPQTNLPNIATFRTTVRPPNFDSLGYAEIQAGTGSGGNVSFNSSFLKEPIVVFSQREMSYNDQNTYLSSSLVSGFQYSAPNSIYWLAVNGNYPFLVNSGTVNGSSSCEPAINATCVNYANPFPSDITPYSAIMRRASSSANNMNYIRDNDNTRTRLAIGGPGYSLVNFNWITFANKLAGIVPAGATSGAVQLGQQATPTLYCSARCQCRAGLTQQDSNYAPCYYYSSATTNALSATISQIPFATSFSTEPSVVTTPVHTNDNFSSYLAVGNTSAIGQLNTPAVRNVITSGFRFGTINTTEPKWCPSASTLCTSFVPGNSTVAGLFQVAGGNNYSSIFASSYNLNWIALNQNFKLQWSYK